MPSIKEFSLPLIVGIIAGMYSSVCLTGAMWYTMRIRKDKKDQAAAQSAAAAKAAGKITASKKKKKHVPQS